MKKYNPIFSNINEGNRYSWVKRELKLLPSGLKILDVGAGEQKFRKYCSHLDYYSHDFAAYDGIGDGIGLQTKIWDYKELDFISDITNIPVEDNSFDAVLCTEVIEHVPDAVLALKEITRILKPNGILLLTAPFNSITHFAPYHFCGYSRYWYEYHLKRFGFNILAIEYNGNWFDYIIQELRRSKYVSKKYTNIFIGFITYIVSIPVIFLMYFNSLLDNKSQEILCFGLMSKSIKNNC